MAAMLKNGGALRSVLLRLSDSAKVLSLEGALVRRWVAAGSSEHTLHVRQQIQETRKKAQLGGGPKRIEAQHKKVDFDFFLVIIIICMPLAPILEKILLGLHCVLGCFVWF